MADLDGGEVTVCRTLELPDMPQGPAEMFKVAYRLAQSSSDIIQLQRYLKLTFMWIKILPEKLEI